MHATLSRITAVCFLLTACLEAPSTVPSSSAAREPDVTAPRKEPVARPGAGSCAGTLPPEAHTAVARVRADVPRTPALEISSIEPSVGTGGTRVHVRGRAFGHRSPGDALFFRGNAAVVESWTNDEIVARVPLLTSGGTQPVYVVKGSASGPDARFDVKPRVTEVAPSTVRPGHVISVAGTNFGSNQGKSMARVGGVDAEVLVWGMTQVVLRVPALADGDHPIELTVGGKGSDPVVVSVSAQAESAMAPTFVSLTFDDTLDSQFQVGEMLSQRGMCGTFYVNSTRIDRAGFMTLAQLRSLVGRGHEIGGHTLNHLHLTSVDADEQRRQVCDDRARLVELGFEPRSFAYPGGRTSEETSQIVSDCGYRTARLVNGGAETVPPVDGFAIRATATVKSTTTLANLQTWVTRTEAKGGWINLVFHPLCLDCGSSGMDPAILDAFVAWLDARRSRGTVVRTVHAMIGGALRPAVSAPPPPPVPVVDGNLLRNPSLELDDNADGNPDCWVRGTPGGTSHWDRSNAAFDGAWSERMTGVPGTSYTDRRLNTVQDMGSCAPSIAPGHVYRASVRFKSASRVGLNAYYRDVYGFWQAWTGSRSFAPADSFTEVTWTLPAAPDDAAAIGIGIAVLEPMEAFVDAFRLEDVTGP